MSLTMFQCAFARYFTYKKDDYEMTFDKSKFSGMEGMITKGYVEGEITVETTKYLLRSLSHDEEADAILRANNQIILMKIEQLTTAIKAIDGKVITDDPEERKYLRELLGKWPSNYINDVYVEFAALTKRIPTLSKEGLEDPLKQGLGSGVSTKSSSIAEPFLPMNG